MRVCVGRALGLGWEKLGLKGWRVESLRKSSLRGWGRGMPQAGTPFLNIMALNPGGVVDRPTWGALKEH